MFSSLASLLFGSYTSATTNSEPNNQPKEEKQQEQQQQQQQQREEKQDQDQSQIADENLVRPDEENTISVTSTTPSVTSWLPGKRNKSKRNKSYRKGNKSQKGKQRVAPSLVKLLTPNESCDEDLNEEEWFIVEKEDEDKSLPRTDSEEELSEIDVKNNTVAIPVVPPSQANAAVLTDRLRQHINTHSLYIGPRPQQQRNLIRRTRKNGKGPLNLLQSSPPGNIDAATNTADIDVDCQTQSLYFARPQVSSSLPLPACSPINSDGTANLNMDESWFVTPPPCFTSIGPINMETSPYENLLIEHPSMSVYRSIRSAQEAADSFVNLDLGVRKSRKVERPTTVAAVSAATLVEAHIKANEKICSSSRHQSCNLNGNGDRFRTAQLKQELLARRTQKMHYKNEQQNLCRGVIMRSNKVRDFQSKSNRQRRSDMQHCKIVSGANNNRKCCF